MGLQYKNTITNPIFGSKVTVPTTGWPITSATRTSVALTDAYDAAATTNIFEVDGYSKLNLDLLYTTGAAETDNSIQVRIEGSPDGVNFYRLPNDSTSAGTSTITAREFTFAGATAATAYPISIGIDIFYKFMRVSVKETGVASNAGTIYGEITLLGL